MSAAITDLIAHGIPTVTTLVTAGPPSPGLTVTEPTVDALVAAITPLLDDDTWAVGVGRRTCSRRDVGRSTTWPLHCSNWLDDVDDLDPATIR